GPPLRRRRIAPDLPRHLLSPPPDGRLGPPGCPRASGEKRANAEDGRSVRPVDTGPGAAGPRLYHLYRRGAPPFFRGDAGGERADSPAEGRSPLSADRHLPLSREPGRHRAPHSGERPPAPARCRLSFHRRAPDRRDLLLPPEGVRL